MRKYLNDLGLKDKDLPWNWNRGDKRQAEWREERKTYGFDERDTWNLNFTLPLLVYERLKMYREIAPINMDQSGISHTYVVDGKEVPYGYIIDRILASFGHRLSTDRGDMTEDEMKEYAECWRLLGLINHSLWW